MKRALCSLRGRSALAAMAMLAVVCVSLDAQMGGGQASAPLPSPAATATVTVAGGTIDVHYNSPRLRGRHIGGPEIVPYGQVWRTGANPATTIITSVPLVFGTLLVPAGTHTLYTLPSADNWQLIINKQTGQWGLTYNQDQDLGRVPMKSKPMTAPQENMSISFENTTAVSTELHVRWETTDRYVVIAAPSTDRPMAAAPPKQ